MNTKSALIIAVAIVIGFSIEPILDRVDFSEPGERLIKVVYSSSNGPYALYVRASDIDWVHDDGLWYDETIGFQPADEYALKTIIEMYEQR